jgi:hypothetical protein
MATIVDTDPCGALVGVIHHGGDEVTQGHLCTVGQSRGKELRIEVILGRTSWAVAGICAGIRGRAGTGLGRADRR